MGKHYGWGIDLFYAVLAAEMVELLKHIASNIA